ncbi:hypothetical protein VX159_14490 [Dechloromonas sp. ZY10]|uniref:hypothetical protein n=1 Tax=Dechloromonas aquae TaxID=2664436 RepID=UPI0035288B79
MPPISEEDLEQTRNALAPTLDATAAILPWLARPATLRFPAELNQRWLSAAARLHQTWSNRHLDGDDDLRPALFALYSICLETADADCLRFGEALASAIDRLEISGEHPKLVTGLSAAIEALDEEKGLEHETFGERCRHFAQRLESLHAQPEQKRSPVIDRLFIDEAQERVEAMCDALAALPPDAYALKTEAEELAQHAEQLELWGVMHQARRLYKLTGNKPASLEYAWYRQRIEGEIAHLSQLLNLIEVTA